MADAPDPAITIVPANEASWEDSRPSSARAATRRGASASATRCSPGSPGPGRRRGARLPAPRADRLRRPGVGHDERARRVPRRRAGRLVRRRAAQRLPAAAAEDRVPWEGRAEDKPDDSVWAVTCFVTRAGFRRRGVSRALARAAVDFARERGARALEGYPMITSPGRTVVGRDPRRQPGRLRGGRLHGGQPPHPPPRRDADRLLARRRATAQSPASYLNEMPSRTR